jgi:putative salt-induced outer membrane protein YdiY
MVLIVRAFQLRIMNTYQRTLHFAVLGAIGATANSVFAHDPNAPPEDPTAWKVKAGANLALAKGNSDTFLVGADILAVKKWDKNELFMGADAAYGDDKQSDEERRTTVQNYGAFLQYNRLITDRWYAYLNVSGRQDRIADIDYRFVISPGVGYYFIKTDRTQLSGEVGPGVVFEEVGDETSNYFIIRFAEHFRHKLSERAFIFQNFEFLPQIDDWDNYVINFDIGVEALLTQRFGLRVTFADIYRSEPAPGREHNDLRLLAGLTYNF